MVVRIVAVRSVGCQGIERVANRPAAAQMGHAGSIGKPLQPNSVPQGANQRGNEQDDQRQPAEKRSPLTGQGRRPIGDLKQEIGFLQRHPIRLRDRPRLYCQRDGFGPTPS